MDAAIKALFGVLAESLGKSQSEIESQLFKGEGEARKLAEPNEIKSYLSPLFADKFKNVSHDRIEQARGKAIKDTYSEVEQLIADKTGITGRLNDGLLDSVLEAQKSIKLDPANVKNSDVYKADTNSLKDLLQKTKEEHQGQLKNMKNNRIRDKVWDALNKWTSSDTLQKPENEKILEKKKKNLLQDLYNTPINGTVPVIDFSEENGIQLLGEDGLPIHDDQLNQIAFTKHLHTIGTEYYFPLKANTPRTSAQTTKGVVNGTTANSGQITIGDNAYNLPSLKDKSEVGKFFVSKEARSLPAEARVEMRKALTAQFEESEN
jgi:hypothetical protein